MRLSRCISRNDRSTDSGRTALAQRMTKSAPVAARVGGCVLSAACLIVGCAACAATAKPTTARSTTGHSVGISLPVSTTAPSGSTQPAKLIADATVRQELVAVFTASRRDAVNTPAYDAIPPSAVAGIAPGTLHYSRDPATGIYWAVADFSPTQAASQTAAAIGFQDGGNDAVFMRAPGRSWRVRSIGPCLAGLPLSVADAQELTAGPNPLCPHGIPVP